MIGQEVLPECLLARDVPGVATIGRSATGVTRQKLREIVHKDRWNYGSIEAQERGRLHAHQLRHHDGRG